MQVEESLDEDSLWVDCGRCLDGAPENSKRHRPGPGSQRCPRLDETVLARLLYRGSKLRPQFLPECVRVKARRCNYELRSPVPVAVTALLRGAGEVPHPSLSLGPVACRDEWSERLQGCSERSRRRQVV